MKKIMQQDINATIVYLENEIHTIRAYKIRKQW